MAELRVGFGAELFAPKSRFMVAGVLRYTQMWESAERVLF
jgi:hypothetical protein